MATFPSISPSYGAQKRSQPAFRSVKFGDGYMSRLTFGLNQDMKEWQLEFRNLKESESDTIESFLEARATNNMESFEWSPPDETDTYKWICTSWTKTLPYSNRATISTTFTQVPEP